MKSQSFMEMIKSAKVSTHDDDLDDEDEFILKRENSTTTTHKGIFHNPPCGDFICNSFE